MQEYTEDKQKSCVATAFFFFPNRLPMLLLWAVRVLWLSFPHIYIELQKQYTDQTALCFWIKFPTPLSNFIFCKISLTYRKVNN